MTCNRGLILTPYRRRRHQQEGVRACAAQIFMESACCNTVALSRHANTKGSFHHQRPRRNTQNETQDRKPHTKINKPVTRFRSIMLH